MAIWEAIRAKIQRIVSRAIEKDYLAEAIDIDDENSQEEIRRRLYSDFHIYARE